MGLSINPVLSETLSLIWGIFFFLCSYYFVHLLSSPKISLVKRSFFIQEFLFSMYPLAFLCCAPFWKDYLTGSSRSVRCSSTIHSAFSSVGFLISVVTILISKVCLSFFLCVWTCVVILIFSEDIDYSKVINSFKEPL